jgi:hypothetical protein
MSHSTCGFPSLIRSKWWQGRTPKPQRPTEKLPIHHEHLNHGKIDQIDSVKIERIFLIYLKPRDRKDGAAERDDHVDGVRQQFGVATLRENFGDAAHGAGNTVARGGNGY